jgi:diketogulonate reductase-like aldo/keto reductase
MELRQKVWDKLAADWNVYKHKEQVIESSLEELDTYIDLMLAKKSKGRVIVKL